MTEHEREHDIRRRYRELAREEPPRALDDAILAAARREVEARPAPLVAPSGRRRWFVPVAAAAVIVLSAVVTLHVQREQPDEELGAPQPMSQAPRKDAPPAVAPRAEMQEDKLAAAPKEIEPLARKAEAPKVEPERRRRQAAPASKPARPSQAPAGGPSTVASAAPEPKAAADQGRFSPDPGPVAAAPPPPPASAPVAAEQRQAIGGLRDAPRYDDRALAKREVVAESPEKMLERIAALRRAGRAKEADDLYAEFRRRFPDYRIPDAMREQVLPR